MHEPFLTSPTNFVKDWGFLCQLNLASVPIFHHNPQVDCPLSVHGGQNQGIGTISIRCRQVCATFPPDIGPWQKTAYRIVASKIGRLSATCAASARCRLNPCHAGVRGRFGGVGRQRPAVPIRAETQLLRGIPMQQVVAFLLRPRARVACHPPRGLRRRRPRSYQSVDKLRVSASWDVRGARQAGQEHRQTGAPYMVSSPSY